MQTGKKDKPAKLAEMQVLIDGSLVNK